MSNFRRYVITTVILIIISCFGVLFYTIFHDDDSVTVPQLVGMSLPDASDALSELGLSAKVEKVDSQEAENTVLTQDVKPGKKVKPGKSLILQVSGGGKQVKIPDVRSMKTEDAIRTLEEAGFNVTKTLKVNDAEHEPGTVLAQNPYGGQTVDSGTAVELLVCAGNALGEGSVYVPDLRGKNVAEAEMILNKAGLAAGEKTVIASVAPEGTVVATKPGIGAKVETGAAIALSVSSGKEAESAKQPVTGNSDVKKENTVKAVKAEAKADRVKKTETKTAAKAEKQAAKTVAKTEVKQSAKTAAKPVVKDTKTETKQTAKAEAAVKDTKTEAKQTAKTDEKTAAKETKTETKQPVKSEAKTETKQIAKTEAKTETKAETKQPAKTETKAAEAKQEQPLKSAKLRYVVPPLVKPMSFKVTLEDARGTHVLKDTTVQGNEVFSIPIKYAGKANLTILLGGEEVWQEFYK